MIKKETLSNRTSKFLDRANGKITLASCQLVKASGRGFCGEDQEFSFRQVEIKTSISEIYNAAVWEREQD